MPSVINPVVVPLTTLIGPFSRVPSPLLQTFGRTGPGGIPVVQPVPKPKPGGQVGSEIAPTYTRYRYLLDELAQAVPGFYGSAEWRTSFAQGTTLDAKLYDLYKKCGNLGETTSGGTAPPRDDSRYVLLTNYLPSLVLKSVAWVVGTTATILWVGSSTLPLVKLPGGGPLTNPGPSTGPSTGPLTGPSIGPVTSGKVPLGARF